MSNLSGQETIVMFLEPDPPGDDGGMNIGLPSQIQYILDFSLVGWVERSETQHPLPAALGFVATLLNPTYGSRHPARNLTTSRHRQPLQRRGDFPLRAFFPCPHPAKAKSEAGDCRASLAMTAIAGWLGK
jgi:hypothetical protein